MIKRLILLLPLLLIQLASFCSIGTDSIYNGSIVRLDRKVYYVFDSITVDGMVKDIIRGDECSETQDSLYSIIKEQDFLSETKSKQIRTIEKTNSILKQKLSLKDEEIEVKDKHIKSLNRSKKINKIIIPTLSGIAIAEAVVILTVFLLEK